MTDQVSRHCRVIWRKENRLGRRVRTSRQSARALAQPAGRKPTALLTGWDAALRLGMLARPLRLLLNADCSGGISMRILGNVALDLKSMSTDQLSILYDEITAILTEKIVAQKRVLEDRLKQLDPVERTSETARRRPYPTVLPKFRNPDNPSETWAGRGKKPRWLSAHLKSGKRIEDFRIGF